MLGFNGGLIGATRNTTIQASVSGIWTLGEQLRARRESLWPVVASYIDPYASSVSLFLKGDGPNASTTFIDSSPAPKTVTAFGNAQISTAQSKFGGASMLFDGAGDYLSVSSNSALTLGTGDFTIEFWLYPSSSLAYHRAIIDTRSGFTDTGVAFFQYGLVLEVYGSNLKVSSAAAALTINTWQHVALVRQSGTCQIYVGGTASGSSATYSSNLTSSVVRIAQNVANSHFYVGYIDDLRITKGVARYTANFTPPGAL